MVTHNRLEYTKRALEAIREAGDADWIVVVDNASSDGTQDWLLEHALRDDLVDGMVCNERNLFPGAATNIGWHEGLAKHRLADATHLMRLDNDVELLPGWREEVERCFTKLPHLGCLGLLNRHEDYNHEQPVDLDETGTVNVHWDQCGGNVVVLRRWWDEGLRWIPGTWSPGGHDEDSVFAAAIREKGGLIGTVVPTIANNMSFHRYQDYPEYYNKTAALRGLVPELSV